MWSNIARYKQVIVIYEEELQLPVPIQSRNGRKCKYVFMFPKYIQNIHVFSERKGKSFAKLFEMILNA